MSGVAIANTPIAVDCWQIRRTGYARLFFLTHLHSDHTQGLTSSWKHPIYCSEITGRVLRHMLKVNKDLIRPLEVGVAHKINLDELGVETMTVTLIDANHCPGSVMFLFKGYFGTILHTGDFRYSPSMFQKPKQIDVLYLDNTNCNLDCKLPSREEATEQIIDIIEKHPNHDVVIGLYKIGKEELLVKLAILFKTWIVVTPERLELLKLLELENVFTAEEGAGRIRVVENSAVNCRNMKLWNHIHPTIAILPTGQPRKISHKDMYIVPYSDHSSCKELQEFVCKLKPFSLEPVVKNQPCEVLQCHLQPLEKPLLKIQIPITVWASMQGSIRRKHCQERLAARRPIVRTTHHRGVVFESPEKCAQTPTNLRDNERSTCNSHVGGTWSTATEDSFNSPSTSEGLGTQDLPVDIFSQKSGIFEDQQDKYTSSTSLEKSPSPAPINLDCTNSVDDKQSMLLKKRKKESKNGEEKERTKKEEIKAVEEKKVEHSKEEMAKLEKGSRPDQIKGVKENCTASSSSTDVPDYLIKYTVILASEQCQTYRNDFNSEYDEYLSLHSTVEKITKTFLKLDSQLRLLLPGSKKYKVVSEELLQEYRKFQLSSPNFSEEKCRCEYLHSKLAHIKKLVTEFKRRQAESLHDCTLLSLQDMNKQNLTNLKKKEDIKRPHQCNRKKKATKRKYYSLVPPANRYTKKRCVERHTETVCCNTYENRHQCNHRHCLHL